MAVRRVRAERRPRTRPESWSMKARRSMPSSKVRRMASGRMISRKPPAIHGAMINDGSLKTIACPRMTGRSAEPPRLARPSYFRTSRLDGIGHGLLQERGGQRPRSVGFPASSETIDGRAEILRGGGEEACQGLPGLLDVAVDEGPDLRFRISGPPEEQIG